MAIQNKQELTGAGYHLLLRYLVAVERSDDFEEAALEYMEGLFDYDAAVYICVTERGCLGRVYAAGELSQRNNIEEFCRADSLFDLGTRASGMELGQVDVYATDTLPSGRHRVALRENGFGYVLSMTIDRSGEGIRIYRRNKPFAKHEQQLAAFVADILSQLLPRRKRIEVQNREAFLERYVREGLPYGFLVYDEDFHPLQYNEEAVVRLEDLFAEKDIRVLLANYEEVLRRHVDTIRHSRTSSTSETMGTYIAETIVLRNTNRTGRSKMYYVSMLYSKQWFRGFLLKSADAVMAEKGLTQRELEIANHILNGCSTKEIAEKLFISVNTVKEHITGIFQKMDVHNRGELIIKIFTTSD